jgi:hypothetical protein
LRGADYLPASIEHHEPGAGRALIDRPYVSRHLRSLPRLPESRCARCLCPATNSRDAIKC